MKVKDKCQHGEFQSLFKGAKNSGHDGVATATFEFRYEHGNRYMRAAKYPALARIGCKADRCSQLFAVISYACVYPSSK